jgi:hypothetical protein
MENRQKECNLEKSLAYLGMFTNHVNASEIVSSHCTIVNPISKTM